jgi:hypothetical protein
MFVIYKEKEGSAGRARNSVEADEEKKKAVFELKNQSTSLQQIDFL